MRKWNNTGKDDGSIHPIGNGHMLVYEQGPNIINLFTPFYSTPSFLSMHIAEDKRQILCESDREKGTAIWKHQVYEGEHIIGAITDYIIPEKALFFRDINVTEMFHFRISSGSGARVSALGGYFDYTGIHSSTVVMTIPKGTTFFATSEPLAQEINLLINFTGDISAAVVDGGYVDVVALPGFCRILFSSAVTYPEAVILVEDVLRSNKSDWMEQSRQYWIEFTGRRTDFSSYIPINHSYREHILDAIDSVSVLIKSQQSKCGGVAAGHYYNLAYVRDQWGVVRGLLALGYIDEARAVLEFWFYKWKLFGNLYNAEGIGNDCARLFFNNDEVEIPSYIILSCFQYLHYTGDDELINHMFPMLEWAFEIQLKHISDGMIEFNGDETYIAGGAFPKFYSYHGSAESTLLFITAGEKLIEWAGVHSKWNGEKLNIYREVVLAAKSSYKNNFFKDGVLYANNPAREKSAGRPRFRFSFCEAHELVRHSFCLTWTEVNSQGYYVCPQCRDIVLPETPQKDKFVVLNSVSLTPLYIDSCLFTIKELEIITAPGMKLFGKTGVVPSNIEGTRSLGYDYGLMLYNMVKLNNPLKELALEKILSLLDPTGSWVEYYDNDVPANCRARPWESGINIEAVIEYIKGLEEDRRD